jgi:hypothetical protein
MVIHALIQVISVSLLSTPRSQAPMAGASIPLSLGWQGFGGRAEIIVRFCYVNSVTLDSDASLM